MYADVIFHLVFFFFKQKTAYEMRISDWSSDVCSSDLCAQGEGRALPGAERQLRGQGQRREGRVALRGRPAFVPGRLGQRFPAPARREIGRASCRERVCQYV